MNYRPRSWTVVLVCCGVVGIVTVWLSDPSRSNRQPNQTRSHEVAQLGNPPLVRLDLLHSAKAASFEPRGRNVFGYYALLRGSQEDQQPPDTTVVSALPDLPGMRPQLFDLGRRQPRFRYIGFLGHKDQLIAVFDKGSRLFLVQVGDVIDGRFELLEVRPRAVILKYLNGKYEGERLRLDMGPR